MAPPPIHHWDADKMFQFYLHDYMLKKGMHSTAEIFKNEAQVPDKHVFIKDSPDGFLHEWWSIFYEVFAFKQEKYLETGIGSSSKVNQVQSPNQDIVARTIACIPQNQTFTIPRNSSKSTTLKIFEAESCDKLKQNYEDASDKKPMYEKVESSLSFENEHVDHEVVPFRNLKQNSTSYKNENKGFSFEEVGCLHLRKNKVLSSHFSSNGKLLAGAGHDKKVLIWNMETFDCVASTEKHSLLITDVRFRPDSFIFATSSFDKSVRLWDATKPSRSQLRLTGHIEQVMSLDFHPRKVDLLCSCDKNDVIRLWNMNECVCMHITKGGNKQVRFQSCLGKFLATSTGNSIKILDVETDHLLHNLEGHVKDVLSICWDKSGNFIASVSEDSARVWSLDGKCISELYSNDNKFQSCIFHPSYLNLLIVGGYQSLEIWNPIESSKTWSIPAHKGLIVGLADSPEAELVASAGHDHCVKIWK